MTYHTETVPENVPQKSVTFYLNGILFDKPKFRCISAPKKLNYIFKKYNKNTYMYAMEVTKFV
jgi:hypothetical protein